MELMDLDKLESLVFDFASRATGYTSDSRNCDSSKIFVALQGLQSDGHEYVAALIDSGNCAGAIVAGRNESEFSDAQLSKCLVVPDTHLAHRLISKYFRSIFKGTLVAIGGSAGKTSTKEFLKMLCESSKKCLVTKGSQNGDQGIPKTLEGLSGDIELAIIEVGIDSPGDMQRHMNIVQPDIGVLTSIGEEHLLYLQNVQTVFEEETKLFDVTAGRGGKCFAPAADAYLAKYQSEHLELVKTDLGGFAKHVDVTTFPVVAIQNLCVAIRVAKEVGIDDQAIESALSKIKPVAGRGRIVVVNPSQTLILDHYNSNPASLRAAFVTVKEQLKSKTVPLYLILGDMLELGEDSEKFHEDLLRESLELKPEKVLTVGSEFFKVSKHLGSKHIQSYETLEEAKVGMEEIAEWPGLFLFKGSRGMALENLLSHFGALEMY